MHITPSRVAALVAALAPLASAVLALLGAVDTISQAIVVSVAILGVVAVAIVWLIGWQKHEARTPAPLLQKRAKS